ncbi:CMD domain protein, partial [Pseudomonas syringae pv. actinidiae]|nr:CMD domain protein [Pseudomonas syringae pv. actinidiae]
AIKAALQALQLQGLSTAEIVVLAQLIAFLSYQVRLAAGLTAIQSAGAA